MKQPSHADQDALGRVALSWVRTARGAGEPVSTGVRLFCRLGLILSLTLPMGCHSVRHSEPMVGPLPTADPKVERGRIAFAQYCSQCHPRGEGGLGPALIDKPLPGFLIKTQVRLGLGSMPDFVIQHLPPEKLDEIVAYLKALRGTRR